LKLEKDSKTTNSQFTLKNSNVFLIDYELVLTILELELIGITKKEVSKLKALS